MKNKKFFSSTLILISMFFITIFEILCQSMGGFAQPTFQKTWGGILFDVAYDIIPTLDNNFIITGSTNNSALSCNNILLMKINRMGDTIWSRTYGRSGGQTGHIVLPTYDGGYLVGASGGGLIGSDDIILMKTDSLGNLLWSKMYGGTFIEFPEKILELSDMGYLYVGTTTSFGYTDPMECDRNNPNVFCPTYHLMRINYIGDTIWTRVIYLEETNLPYSFIELKDGNFLITGTTNSSSKSALLLKIDSTGSILWSKIYRPKFIEAQKVIEIENGHLMIMGNGYRNYGIPYSGNTGGIIMAETDNIGNIIDIKITDDGNDTTSRDDYGSDFNLYNNNYWFTFLPELTDNGDTCIAGIMKVDKLLNIVWQKAYGYGVGGLTKTTVLPDCITISVSLAKDIGKGSIDVFLFSVDSNGNSDCNMWDKNLIFVNIDPTTIQVVDTGFFVGNTNTVVIDYPMEQGYPQLEMQDCDDWNSIDELRVAEGLRVNIVPNPNKGRFTVEIQTAKCKMQNVKCKIENAEISVYNIFGQEVKSVNSRQKAVDKNTVFIDMNKEPNGMYFVEVDIGEERCVGKAVVVK